jgi:capsular polysaccharide biosynthesis protein
MSALRVEHPSSDTVGSVMSPSEVRRFAGLPDLGPPEAGPVAVAAGRRLAQHPLVSSRHGRAGDDDWLSGAQLLLAPLGVHLELLKIRPGGAVLRCRASSAISGAAACDLAKAVIESVPGASGRPGTVVETTCMKRGAEGCLYMLLWEADGPSANGHAHAPDASAADTSAADTSAADGHAPDASAPDAHARPSPSADLPSGPAPGPVPGPQVRPSAAGDQAPAVPLSTWVTDQPAAAPSTALADQPPTDRVMPVVDPAAKPIAAPPSVPTAMTDRGVDRLRPPLPAIGGRQRRARGRAPWLRRRAWMLVIAALAGGIGGLWAGNHKGVSYSAQATLVVQSGSGRSGPGNANDANALAITYSALLPTDSVIVGSAARTLGVSPTTLSHHLSVSVETGTAVMLLKYSAPTVAAAVRGAQTVARAAAGAAPPSAAIPAGSLVVVQLPTTASIAGSLHKVGLPLGILLGLVVGAILVIAVERADPRLDTAEQLAAVCGCPATSVPDGMTIAEIARAISRVVGPASRVTVVPVAGVDTPAAVSLGRALAADRTSGDPAFEIGPSFETGADELAGGSGPTMLVTSFGAPRRRVQAAVERLRLLGREPLWAALAGTTVGKPEIPSRAG